ncbi:hypothetical protein KAR02_10285, partial [Candidatus Bipolaricaulota bacterium]|nr:hypothetical protein [Candidatus Bipolaricaulota bacterium]
RGTHTLIRKKQEFHPYSQESAPSAVSQAMQSRSVLPFYWPFAACRAPHGVNAKREHYCIW